MSSFDSHLVVGVWLVFFGYLLIARNDDDDKGSGPGCHARTDETNAFYYYCNTCELLRTNQASSSLVDGKPFHSLDRQENSVKQGFSQPDTSIEFFSRTGNKRICLSCKICKQTHETHETSWRAKQCSEGQR